MKRQQFGVSMFPQGLYKPIPLPFNQYKYQNQYPKLNVNKIIELCRSIDS